MMYRSIPISADVIMANGNCCSENLIEVSYAATVANFGFFAVELIQHIHSAKP